MTTFGSFSGIITMVNDFLTGDEATTGCYKLMSVQNSVGNTVNFVVTPSTYFVDHAMMTVGESVIGFYDANAPVPLIYPPQYQAIVMAQDVIYQNIKVAFFNQQLVSNDGTLKLMIGPFTRITSENGQIFTANPSNRDLIAVYGVATKSIPAQTIPYQMIVLCRGKCY